MGEFVRRREPSRIGGDCEVRLRGEQLRRSGAFAKRCRRLFESLEEDSGEESQHGRGAREGATRALGLGQHVSAIMVNIAPAATPSVSANVECDMPRKSALPR